MIIVIFLIAIFCCDLVMLLILLLLFCLAILEEKFLWLIILCFSHDSFTIPSIKQYSV